ncbi:MAG: hypothetical protein ABIJ34_06580 [archaeon]
MTDSNGSKKETVSFSVAPGWSAWIKKQVEQGKFRNKSHCAEEALKLMKDQTDTNSSHKSIASHS